MKNIKLILVDPKQALCAAFQERFKDLPNVQIVNGKFEQLPFFDCMVSAANSFGLMDGCVHAAITQYFGH
jgi:ubiquinone/menaquinone biosynthesis C-methylase UbiE